MLCTQGVAVAAGGELGERHGAVHAAGVRTVRVQLRVHARPGDSTVMIPINSGTQGGTLLWVVRRQVQRHACIVGPHAVAQDGPLQDWLGPSTRMLSLQDWFGPQHARGAAACAWCSSSMRVVQQHESCMSRARPASSVTILVGPCNPPPLQPRLLVRLGGRRRDGGEGEGRGSH